MVVVVWSCVVSVALTLTSLLVVCIFLLFIFFYCIFLFESVASQVRVLWAQIVGHKKGSRKLFCTASLDWGGGGLVLNIWSNHQLTSLKQIYYFTSGGIADTCENVIIVVVVIIVVIFCKPPRASPTHRRSHPGAESMPNMRHLSTRGAESGRKPFRSDKSSLEKPELVPHCSAPVVSTTESPSQTLEPSLSLPMATAPISVRIRLHSSGL